MTEPVRPNTVSTGTDTAAGDNHIGTPPDIESTSPLAPFVRPIVLPTRVSPLLKLKIFSFVPTTPDKALTLPEREERLEFVVEREPEREVRFPEREVRLPERPERLPLSVVKSLNRLTILPERDRIFALADAREPESVKSVENIPDTEPERVTRLVFVVERVPESVLSDPDRVEITPDSIFISPLFEAIAPDSIR